MSIKKLPVELIGKIISKVKGEPSLARTMGKYLSKKEKEQLTDYSTKTNLLKTCNLAQVKNLHLLGVKFTMDDLLIAAGNRCVDTVKFLQEVSSDCLIKIDYFYNTDFDFNTFQTLLDSIKSSQLKRNDFLELIGLLLWYIIDTMEDNSYKFLYYLIERNPYNYKYNLKDILTNTSINGYLNQYNYSQRLEIVINILDLLIKSKYNLTASDIKWLLTDYIVPANASTPVFLVTNMILVPPILFLQQVKKKLKKVKMENMYNDVVSKYDKFLVNLDLRKQNSNKLPGSWN